MKPTQQPRPALEAGPAAPVVNDPRQLECPELVAFAMRGVAAQRAVDRIIEAEQLQSRSRPVRRKSSHMQDTPRKPRGRGH